MTDRTNWAKVIGELLADHEIAQGKQMDAVIARLAELEALPITKNDEPLQVPAELAAQLERVRQLLDEPPPVIEPPPPPAPPRRVTGTEIIRGELAVLYSDGTVDRLGPVVGPPGPAGRDGADGVAGAKGESGQPGRDGKDGADGARGEQGPPGRDGVSITATARNKTGELMLTLSDGTVLTVDA
jgi:hypothetical protein